ncbi:hypothetical protein [Streptomyces sp. bgisy100]|uniref:hypothetical protein n=1 Tax=Streptomyces sp. bgisy100 TaxID=3413783 RepID=UPI003D7544F1
MTTPPPPHDAPHPAAGGFGPPQGLGSAPGHRPAQGAGQGPGYGPAQGSGQGPVYGPAQGGSFGPPQAYGPHRSDYGAYPPPVPGGTGPSGPGGPNGPKIAAIFIAGVLAAGLAVGGFLLFLGSGDRGAAADAKPDSRRTADTDRRPGAPGADGQASPSAAPSSAAPSAGDLVPFVALSPGQCFDHPALDPSVSGIETRSCRTAHDGEVVANATLSGDFSSERGLQEKSLKLCEKAVTSRMKTVPEDGRQYYSYALYPSLQTYRIRDEKRISCALTLSDGPDGKKMTGPLAS